jgi:ATP-dependent helicase YprA (DUF1998 family)
VRLIDDNGAPAGRKHFAFYNPPIVNKPLHIRKSATVEVNELAKTFPAHGFWQKQSSGSYFLKKFWQVRSLPRWRFFEYAAVYLQSEERTCQNFFKK